MHQGSIKERGYSSSTETVQAASLEANSSEHKFWVDNDVYDIVDMRKHLPRSFVKGRWVLTAAGDKDGMFY